MPRTVANLALAGALNSVLGHSLAASCMNSTKTGTAAVVPVSPSPRLRLSSKPTNTPATTWGVKPTNQALRYSLVVPVLPPTGRFSTRAEVAVPRWTTPCSIEVI